MITLDFTKVSRHVQIDRQVRFSIIEKTVGWGNVIYEAPDRKTGDCTICLTTTGAMIIVEPDGTIATAWIASVAQAMDTFKRATNQERMPKWLWNIVNYNNNTELWQKLVA